MKIAVTADWHLNNFQEFSTTLTVVWDEETLRYVVDSEGNSMNSRLFNQLQALCDMRDYCVKNGIQNLLIAGDIFHKRGTIDVSVYNAGYKILNSFKLSDINVTAISGNHDDVDNSKIPVTSINPLQEVMTVIESPKFLFIKQDLEDESVGVLAIPYSKDKNMIVDTINRFVNEGNTKDSILLCHLGITGGVVGSGQYSMKDEYNLSELRYNKWKYVIAGHYHQPQVLEYNSIYTGSPTQNNFGDERNGNNGFFVIDTKKRWDMRFISLNAPRFITVTPKNIDKFSQKDLSCNYIRVISDSDNLNSIQNKLENSVKDFSHIRVEIEKSFEEEQRSEINISHSFEESVRLYAKENYKGDNLQDIQDLGLAILHESGI